MTRRKGFGRDEDGAVLVFVGMALAVFLGLVAMSFDLGRVSVTNSDLQSYADSVALAAAAELDGRADAITRAEAAAAALITDGHTFGTGDRTLAGAADYSLVFLTSLPAADTTALPNGLATTDPARAAFAWVTVNAVEVDQGFARAFRTLSGQPHANPQTRATAVAGMTQMACDITPMMFCVPPGTAADGGGAWRADNHVGEMVRLRESSGPNAAWGPGNFGFLQLTTALDPNGVCAGLNGGPLYRCLISASTNITRCVAVNGVSTDPGQSVGLNQGINTRFDIYDQTLGPGARSNPAYAPAPNVTKGVRFPVPANQNQTCPGNGATNSPVENFVTSATTPPTRASMALPRDNCFESIDNPAAPNTCANGRFGDGAWNRVGYVAVNHAGIDPVPAGGYANVEPGSRYEMYLAEIERAYGTPYPAPGTAPITGATPISSTSETGLPICAAPSGNHNGSERRLLVAAGIDCNTTTINGHSTGIPVEEYVLMFLTEPMRTGSSVDIHVEIVGSVSADGSGSNGMGGVFHDVVQLYR